MIAAGLVLYAIVGFIVIAACPPLGWLVALPLVVGIAFTGDATRG